MRINIMIFLAGALLPLSLAPFYVYPIALLSLAGLFWAWQDATPRQAAWRGWLFGLGMFGVGTSWLYVAFHQFGGMNMVLSALMTLVFTAFLAGIIAALGWLLKRVMPVNMTARDMVLIFPLAWLGFEWFKTWFLTGFPWLEVGIGQVDGALAGYIPIIGVQGVSLLTAVIAACSLVAWQEKSWRYFLPAAAILVGAVGLTLLTWTQPIGAPVKVAVIQGNILQSLKWDPEQAAKTLAVYRELTRDNWDADVIVWPENALPVFYHQALETYLEPLAEEARKTNTEIILGLPYQVPGTQDYHNSAVSLGGERNFYHKQRLVPFGEYLPLASMLKGVIAFFDLPMSGFVPGAKGQALLKVAGAPVGVSICYDDVYPSVIRETVPEARMLINLSNNAWYGNSLAPHQHLQIARARALEVGRPIIRSTTNGISALIDHRGKVIAQAPQLEQAVLRGKVELRQGSTVYVTYGRWILGGIIALMMGIWIIVRQRGGKA